MGSIYPKPELQPLLPSGHHRMTLDELRSLCVDKFPLSKTRSDLFDGLRNLLGLATRLQITAEVLIDGSFLTEKIDPDDVDVHCGCTLSCPSIEGSNVVALAGGLHVTIVRSR